MKIFNQLINYFRSKFIKKDSIKIDVNYKYIEDKCDETIKYQLESAPNFFNNLYKFRNNIKYWQVIIKSIIFAESEFNQFERYYENDLGYYSEGLMQLSIEDNRYYDIGLTKNNILLIEPNIKAGMIILDTLIKNHGGFIFNDGNYWSTLQPKNKRHQIFLDRVKFYQNRGDI